MTRRPLYEPTPVLIRADEQGRPAALEGIGVEAVREDWVVEDRWWSGRPIRRHYFELTLRDGRSETVFSESRRWFRQRA